MIPDSVNSREGSDAAFAPVSDVIAEVARGGVVVIVDDVCVSLTPERAEVLAVQGAAAVDVDLLDEEVADEHAVAGYLTQRDRGVATVRLTALDWAPESISREAQQFIEQQRRLHWAATGGRAAVLTPALGRRRNLRLVHIDSLDVDRLSSACVQQLTELAFPHPFHHRRRRYEHVPRREGHPGGSCDGRIDHREHR